MYFPEGQCHVTRAATHGIYCPGFWTVRSDEHRRYFLISRSKCFYQSKKHFLSTETARFSFHFIFQGFPIFCPVYDTWAGTWKEQCVLTVSNTHDSLVETCPGPRPHEHHVLSWATNTIFFLSLTEQSQANSNAFETNLPCCINHCLSGIYKQHIQYILLRVKYTHNSYIVLTTVKEK